MRQSEHTGWRATDTHSPYDIRDAADASSSSPPPPPPRPPPITCTGVKVMFWECAFLCVCVCVFGPGGDERTGWREVHMFKRRCRLHPSSVVVVVDRLLLLRTRALRRHDGGGLVKYFSLPNAKKKNTHTLRTNNNNSVARRLHEY